MANFYVPSLYILPKHYIVLLLNNKKNFRWRILRGVKILRINTKHNVLWTLGVGIPGETGAMCYLFDTVLPLKKLQTPPPFPTHPPAEDLPLEYYDESIHLFEEPSLAFEET